MRGKFKIYEEDYMGEEFKEFEAYNSEDAVEQYASKCRNDECQLYDYPIEVEVEDEKGTREKYSVYCEPMPNYIVTQII